jgi:5-(carboxyamino)imidazole ribonucleotide mutase
VQMPKGIPVATFAIGEAGAANSALAAIAMLANDNVALAKQLEDYRASLVELVAAMTLPPEEPTHVSSK